MTEQQANLEIHRVTKGDNTYNNIVLKPTKKQRDAGIKGLEPGNFIIVEKIYDEGKELVNTFDGKMFKSYSCRAKYGDEDVSFFLNERQHEAYRVLGAAGSLIKIISTLQQNSRTGTYYVDFMFELV